MVFRHLPYGILILGGVDLGRCDEGWPACAANHARVLGTFDRGRVCAWIIAVVLIVTGETSLLSLLALVPLGSIDHAVTEAVKLERLLDSFALIAGVGLILQNRIAHLLALVIVTLSFMNFGTALFEMLADPSRAAAGAAVAVTLLAAIFVAWRWPTAAIPVYWTVVALGATCLVAAQIPLALGGLTLLSSSVVTVVLSSAIGVFLYWSYCFLRTRKTWAEFF